MRACPARISTGYRTHCVSQALVLHLTSKPNRLRLQEQPVKWGDIACRWRCKPAVASDRSGHSCTVREYGYEYGYGY
eukprot:958219-Pelagomonas_calceolata.AAC.1